MDYNITYTPILTNGDFNDAPCWFVTKDGKTLFLPPWTYDVRVDLTNMRYTNNKHSRYKTINQLVESGELKVVYPYIEVDLNLNTTNRGYDLDIDQVMSYFKEKGYNVTRMAVMYCFNAWKGGFKSGYRDDGNGYHLFTPCGSNPLQFRLTTLCPQGEHWQVTYTC